MSSLSDAIAAGTGQGDTYTDSSSLLIKRHCSPSIHIPLKHHQEEKNLRRTQEQTRTSISHGKLTVWVPVEASNFSSCGNLANLFENERTSKHTQQKIKENWSLRESQDLQA
jgi:hypothetical protein